MRFSNPLYLAAWSLVAADCSFEEGNWYCGQTSALQYQNVGFSGSYNRVTSFNSDGTCSSTPNPFSGPLSPLDEEVSVHFRGPVQLANFAVYTQGSSAASKKRHLHHRHAEANPEPVIVTQTAEMTAYVTVDAEGNLLTNTEPAAVVVQTTQAPAAAAALTTSVGISIDGAGSSAPAVVNYNYNGLAPAGAAESPTSVTTSPGPAATTSQSQAPAPSTGGGSWSQVASYNAASGSSNGLAFLNNLGGSGSGIFDYQWGNSLSYAGTDGVSAASSPQVLANTVVPSNKEFIIFSSDECGPNNGDCGYYRPGTVANHGFGGNAKIFLMEFSMPTETSAAPGSYNYDMPAVWLLNAQIPRTLQYGEVSCSCWKSGCGELDLFEVLNAGNDKCTTTLHDGQDGAGKGSNQWFQRPTSGTLTAAVVFSGETISIVQLDSFPTNVDDSTVQGWISQAASGAAVAF